MAAEISKGILVQQETIMTKKALTILIAVYFCIAGFIFLPYYNYKYARDNGFVKWLFLGEVVPTLQAIAWPYFLLQDRTEAHGPDERTSARKDDTLPWPEPTDSEKEKFKHIWIKAKSEPLTEEDLSDYKKSMIEYSNRVGRKFVAKDADLFTNVLDILYSYRNEYGKSMLASIDKKEPIMTHEYESAVKTLLETGLMNRQTVEEEKEAIKSAAKQTIHTDSEGIKHYPPNKEHVLEIMGKNKTFRNNIDAIKKVHFELAAAK